MNEQEIRDLYDNLLNAWNNNDAKAMAELCSNNANFIGFDGSQHNGRSVIEADMKKIFSNHKVPSFIYKIREVRFLSNDVAILRSVVSMVPQGGNDIIPEVNAIQTLVAAKRQDKWLVEIFQNTPAAYHGRPELMKQLTDELREVLKSKLEKQ
ncbi:MAG TPA: SgcJ/EcaC family oxidoreductase [Ignavibacteria bacterium]|nr:SgcJ/EcaC family oxidoreductase [Ignavibacteria bacterium]